MDLAAWLRSWILPLAGVLALGIAASEYRALRVLDLERFDASLERLRMQQPWGGLAGQALVQPLHGRENLDLAAAEAALAWTLSRYPLNPWRWLDRAEFAYLAGEDWARVLWHLDSAVAVQPRSNRLRLRAAEIAWRTGHYPVAEENLRFWLEEHPDGTEQALRVASGWIPDADPLLDRILPEGTAYLARTLSFARRERRLDVALLAWERLPRPRPPGDGALLDFVDLAMASGRRDLAAAAWAESFPDFVPGGVPNADFQHPLGSERGLNWRRRLPAGVRAERDLGRYRTEPASLRIDFLGSHNVALNQFSLTIPVAASADAQRLRLSGHWRAESLTTRSLPYLELTTGGRGRTRLGAPGSSFAWTPFAMDIDVPADAAALTLRIRRDAVQREFDRNISGRLWIDALRLEPAPSN